MNEEKNKLFEKYKYIVPLVLSKYGWQTNKDILQEGYLILLNCLNKYDDSKKDTFKAYIQKSIKLSIIRKIKQHKRHENEICVEDNIENDLEYPNNMESEIEDKITIENLLECLEKEDREFMYLIINNNSFDDIALKIGKSYKCVKNKYYKIIKKIKEGGVENV